METEGLKLYLREHALNVCYEEEVKLRQLVNNYVAGIGKNAKAKIVVDTLSSWQTKYRGPADVVMGYEVRKITDDLRKFVNTFKYPDVQLIFFFNAGGRSETEKAMSKNQFRARIEGVHKSIDLLATEGHLPNKMRPLLSILPDLKIAWILKYVLDCEVHMALENYEEEVIKYVKEHECFAIFTENTHFVSCQVDAIVLSSQYFNMYTKTTYLHDRIKLARQLCLEIEELPLLAIIAGTKDSVPINLVKEFERRIGLRKYAPIMHRIPTIARYIVDYLRPNGNIEMKLIRLAIDLRCNFSEAELLKKRYFSYFVPEVSDVTTNPTPTDEWSKILQLAGDRCRKAELPALAYSVLCKQTFEDSHTFEDLRKNCGRNKLMRNRPSATVLRPLRSRLYGILLHDKEDPSVPEIQEWRIECKDSYQVPDVVKPIKPEAHHPGLLKLWSGSDDDLNEVRWTLFLATISPSLKATRWHKLFKDTLLLTTLTVYHLYETEYLNESELDAALVTIATCPRYNECLPWPEKINIRATAISITLKRAFELVVTVLATCGCPVKLSESNVCLQFEGKLFQKKYVDVIESKMDIESLCENDDCCVKTFKQMKDIITGTENDNSSAEDLVSSQDGHEVET